MENPQWHRDCTPEELHDQLAITNQQIEHTKDYLLSLEAVQAEILGQINK